MKYLIFGVREQPGREFVRGLSSGIGGSNERTSGELSIEISHWEEELERIVK